MGVPSSQQAARRSSTRAPRSERSSCFVMSSRRSACSPDPARLCPRSPTHLGRLATIVATISIWPASRDGRRATVPRCSGCLLLPAGLQQPVCLLLRPLAQPTTPAPMTIHRHEWKVSAPLLTCVWIDWRHSCGATVLGLSAAACWPAPAMCQQGGTSLLCVPMQSC